MGNKQRKRKKGRKAIKVTNTKNALQRYMKKSMGQPNLLTADSTENRHMDILTSSNKADFSETSFITLDPVETQQPVTLTDIEATENPLIVENELKEDECQPVSGRRIIDLNYILQELQEKARHNGLFDCTIGNFRLMSEKRRGLLSVYRFECNMCKQVCLINSEAPNDKEQVNLNIAATTGIIASGIGFSQFEELFSSMDIPVFSSRYYSKLEDEVFEKWKETASASMEAAAQMEKDIAIAEGRTKNGIPVIDVYVDGSWCARSYGTNYKASSGTAAIIGRRTGQVLYIGIKNKYCLACARAEHKNMSPKQHKCFKNYKGSSSSMETEIIVEGFKASIPMYGIIYDRMIGDGDASTYAAILKARPYGTENVTVEKIECRNHILRNFCKKLRNLTTETKYVLAHRKMLTDIKIMTMRKSIVQSIRHHKASEIPRNVAISSLHSDIINCVAHAFGDHRMCQEYYCTKDKNDNEELKKIQNSTFIFRINAIVSAIPAICMPDGCTLVPWCLGRPLAWDATCVDTLAPSHVEGSARKPGTAADQAQMSKRRKYAFLTNDYEFVALAVETLGPWSSDTKTFIKEVSARLIGVSGDHRAGSFFAQRLSLAVQRGNAARVLGTMPQAGELGGVFYI